ncbi:unnamed protein product [Didymodactylos carnosus]|uniref:SecA family profile domain-containing protein n=1 Tax=Didymodactylos carnosus TaxID=1234261 RepID=A0A8S2CKC7_9BILA|nr:unnamed protein product [Didymodactylos carnosus]CAF3499519.1 unnamed protein product [Didymodactylos carnosus]
MAGRGTDIKLGEGVTALGGLFVLGTNKHESRRIDNQLRGRSGRQGDPGLSQFFISIEDDLFKRFGREKLQNGHKLFDKMIQLIGHQACLLIMNANIELQPEQQKLAREQEQAIAQQVESLRAEARSVMDEEAKHEKQIGLEANQTTVDDSILSFASAPIDPSQAEFSDSRINEIINSATTTTTNPDSAPKSNSETSTSSSDSE